MGIGTLIAALMPYSIAFFIAWTAMILLWFFMGWPLGPDGLISYDTP
jgi:aminobenzoyl-glutamate transport protein